VNAKNADSPATARSGKTQAGTPEPTVIEPLLLNRGATAKRNARIRWKAVLAAAGILAVVAVGSGILLNRLSKPSLPGLIGTPTPAPLKPATPQSGEGAEEKAPLHAQELAKEERPPASAVPKLGMEKTQAERALPSGSKSGDALREKDPADRSSSEDRYHRHMSSGLTAYHEKNYARAKSELTKAQELRPNARETQEALAQVEAAVRLQSIGAIQAKAAEAEALEDWGKALDLYAAALVLDGTLQFAVQGRERALERIQIDKRLQFYLEKPEALESDESLARALEVMNRAEGVEPRGPRLNHQLDTLRGILKEAQSPINVTLLSDNFTEVSVYRVGRLGRFTARELLLRPGRYTVVGMREGYKDVRQEVLVKPGETRLRVTIECREKV
jgi:hypothetical protein